MKGTMNKNKNTRNYALIIATLSSFMTPFMGSSINIALPSIQNELIINAVQLSWVATAYLLTSSVTLIPFGRLADIYGRKKILITGTSIFTVSSFLSALCNSAYTLIAARSLQGIGASMIFATGIAMLISVFPPEKRGRVLGINVAAVYIGLSMGPFGGGLLTQYFGWRSVFLINVPIGVLIILLLLKLKSEWAEAKGEKYDWFGAAFYSVSLGCLMYGLSSIPSEEAIFFIIAGVAGLSAFILWIKKAVHPLFKITLFQENRVFVFSSLAAFIHYSATFAMTFLLSLYLQYLKGLDPQSAGIILISQPLVMALLSPFAGRLSDRFDSRIIASTGMGVTFICLLLFANLDWDSTLFYMIVSLVISGLGFALFSSPNTNAIMGSVDKKYYGLASGTAGTMRLLGMMGSMAIVTVLFTIYIGRVDITPFYYANFLTTMQIAFLIFAGLSFAGIFASVARGKVKTHEQAD